MGKMAFGRIVAKKNTYCVCPRRTTLFSGLSGILRGIIWPILTKNYMKLKRFWSVAPPLRPLDPPMLLLSDVSLFASEKYTLMYVMSQIQWLPTGALNTLQILDFDPSAPSALFVCNAAHVIQSARLLPQIDNRFFHYRTAIRLKNRQIVSRTTRSRQCLSVRHDGLWSTVNMKASIYWREIKESQKRTTVYQKIKF